MPLPIVFTRAMAVHAGWQLHDIDREVRARRWTPLRRGIYALTAAVPADGPGRLALEVAALQLGTEHDVVGTHETAAQVHGLPLFTAYDGPLRMARHRELAQERPGQAAPGELVSHVAATHRASVSGAVVTSVARTAVDLARQGPALSAVVVLDGALRLGTPRQELERVLDDCRGWPGIQRARDWVAFADGRAESALESVGRWRMHEAALPPPELQVVLRDVDGPIGRTDFHWAAHRTVGEADGFSKYRSADGTADFAALRAEKMREDRLREAGFEVFRFTWAEAVHRPAVIAVRARRAFARAAARAALDATPLRMSGRSDARSRP